MNCCKRVVKLAVAGLAVVTATEVLAAGSLADAKAQIASALKDATKMTALVKGMSPADQKAFVGDVNAAIEKLPGDEKAKAAQYVAANQAMLKGVEPKNVSAMVAEVFAKVPAGMLPAVAESFSKNLFDRSAAKVSDAQYAAVADGVMKAVSSRVANAGDAAVRTVCAAVMLAKASNGSPADLPAKLAEFVPAVSRDVAKSEWIPQAMKGNYDPMFASADVGEVFSSDLVLRAPAPDVLGALAADLRSDIPVISVIDNPIQNAQPMNGIDNELPVAPIEPRGYQGQD